MHRSGRVDLEILAEVEHERVDRPRGRRAGHAPDPLEQVAPRRHRPLVLDEIAKQLHLEVREPHRLFAAACLPGVEVHLGIAEAVDARGQRLVFRRHGPLCRLWPVDRHGSGAAMAAPTGQQVADDREELIEVERLLQVDVRARIEATDPVLDERPGGEHHDRHVAALFADRLADGVAAHARQHQIEHDEIHRSIRRRNGRQRRLTVARGRDGKPFGLEVVLDADCQMLFVFDDENVRHGCVHDGGHDRKTPGKIRRHSKRSMEKAIHGRGVRHGMCWRPVFPCLRCGLGWICGLG